MHASAFIVLVLGAALTVSLSLSARAVHNTNEDRLLRERVQEAGTLIGAVVPSVETPLASAAEVAEATNASRASFGGVMGPLVGTNRQFASASIWSTDPTKPAQPLLTLGSRPGLLNESSPEVKAFLTAAAHSKTLTVVGFLHEPQPRLAFAFASQSGERRYLAYAETGLPKSRRSQVIQGNAAFAELAYAVYLGSSESSANLLVSSTAQVPLRGRRSSVTESFGNNTLTVVMSPTTQLGGTLLARLQWLLLGFGLLLAFGASALTERLVRRREQAQRLAEELGEIADENARLYSAQRTVAQTLQHSLLPEIPETAGLVVRARYIAGVAEMDVGGDWYDVVPLENGHVLFVVGDVSGRGLAAATIMASLRYAIRAYAMQGDDPATILTKLDRLISVESDGHFATVLCGTIDVDAHQVTIANAGHPEPLLVDGDNARFVATNVAAPIGVVSPRPITKVTITVPPRATLLAYTDGLVERRGEVLDTGLGRLRDTASRTHTSTDELIASLSEHLPPGGPADDVAILGIQWTT